MKKLLPVFFSIMAMLILPFFSCQTEKISGIEINNQPQLDSLLDSYVENGSYPFIYARLEDIDGKLLYEHGIVNQDLLPGEKVDGKSWIRIWSMSKIVTTTLIMDLVEDGILDLSDPVTTYIPEFKELKVAVNPEGIELSGVEDPDISCPFSLVPVDSVMTIMHLLNHQAGFYYATTNIPCLDSLMASKNIAASENSQDFITRLASLPLIHQPGARDYYGTSYAVLGIVAERATQKSLKQLIEERLTEPLGIEGLQYSLPSNVSLFPRFSGKDSVLREAYTGELDIFGPDVPDYDPAHELYLGGEGMLATAEGYADFLRMLLQRGRLDDSGFRYLESSSIDEIIAPHTQLDNPYGYNGFNLWISGDSMRVNGQGDAGLWIGGGYEGTHFWADPKRNIVGVVMSQLVYIPPQGYGRDNHFRGAIYSQLLESEKQAGIAIE